MLQRRMGMIWTSSGCAVCTSPRANSRSERALRLTDLNDKSEIIALSRRRLGRPQPPHVFADLQRSVENHADRDEAEEIVPCDSRHARGGNAAALAAVGRAAVLTRRDGGLQIRREHGRRSR